MAKRNEIKMPTQPDVGYMQSWCTNFLRKGFGKNIVLVPANKPNPPLPIYRVNANPIYQQPLSTRRSRANPLKQLVPVEVPPVKEKRTRVSSSSSRKNPMLLNTSGTPSPIDHAKEKKTRKSTGTRTRMLRTSSNPVVEPSVSPPKMIRTSSNPVRTPN